MVNSLVLNRYSLAVIPTFLWPVSLLRSLSATSSVCSCSWRRAHIWQLRLSYIIRKRWSEPWRRLWIVASPRPCQIFRCSQYILQCVCRESRPFLPRVTGRNEFAQRRYKRQNDCARLLICVLQNVVQWIGHQRWNFLGYQLLCCASDRFLATIDPILV